MKVSPSLPGFLSVAQAIKKQIENRTAPYSAHIGSLIRRLTIISQTWKRDQLDTLQGLRFEHRRSAEVKSVGWLHNKLRQKTNQTNTGACRTLALAVQICRLLFSAESVQPNQRRRSKQTTFIYICQYIGLVRVPPPLRRRLQGFVGEADLKALHTANHHLVPRAPMASNSAARSLPPKAPNSGKSRRAPCVEQAARSRLHQISEKEKNWAALGSPAKNITFDGLNGEIQPLNQLKS